MITYCLIKLYLEEDTERCLENLIRMMIMLPLSFVLDIVFIFFQPIFIFFKIKLDKDSDK